MDDKLHEKLMDVNEQTHQGIIDSFEVRLEELMYNTMEELEEIGEEEVDILSSLKDVLEKKLQEVEDYPEHPWGKE